ncbi:hypothetical protein POVWA2_007090 [Plasmodium ovale wallikeri]|uniref:Uncharacterized protein n=1 Tax=Plasmodium ovale wallikeri TaxID=864142 RepID=A0A1A8YIL1_PLAOA|nr:hypothetical protein POVWA1_006870 [Plasmodium ovale wallikeri]SBT31981.1 hypothetical protein POVWA2_007090 [Plasmodium ovale wallikeri]
MKCPRKLSYSEAQANSNGVSSNASKVSTRMCISITGIAPAEAMWNSSRRGYKNVIRRRGETCALLKMGT